MEISNRKKIRLENFDYSSNGAYFVTICTHNRQKILSKICRDDPRGRPQTVLYPVGKLAADTMDAVERTYGVHIDYRVIMPDHIHLIVFLPERQPGEKAVSLGRIIGAYKSIVANQWLKECKAKGEIMGEIWQRGFYEHIIRNEADLREIREYIVGNPDRWAESNSCMHR